MSKRADYNEQRRLDQLKKDIEMFKQTGKLPEERDIVERQAPLSNSELNELTLAHSEVSSSVDMGLLLSVLTPREREVWDEVVEGQEIEHIAQFLGISERRARALRDSARRKLLDKLKES